MTSMSVRLMWHLVGHCEPEEMKDGKCIRCGKEYERWRLKVAAQTAALQEDCCDGIVLTKASERSSDAK
jgi:hypothetical protein